MAPTNDRLISTPEAAAILGRREQTLIAWRTRQTPNRPQPVKVGTRAVRYRESDVLAFRDREAKVVAWSGDRKSSKKRGR